RDRALIISDGRYTTQLEQECPGIDLHIRPVGWTMMQGIADLVGRLRVRALAFEAEDLSVAAFEALKEKLPGVEWVGVKHRVEALRHIKEQGEIAAIREAIGIAERAFAMLRAGLRPDDTEKGVADDLEGYLRRFGATSSSFPRIVAVGPHAALPHYRPSPGA